MSILNAHNLPGLGLVAHPNLPAPVPSQVIDDSYFTKGCLNHKVCDLKAALRPFQQIRFAKGFIATPSMIEELFCVINSKDLPVETALSTRHNIALINAGDLALVPARLKNYLLSPKEPILVCPYVMKCESILLTPLLGITCDFLPHTEVESVSQVLTCDCNEKKLHDYIFKNRDQEALDLFTDMLRQELPLSTFPNYLIGNINKTTQFDFSGFRVNVTKEFMADLLKLCPNLSELAFDGHEIKQEALTLLPQFRQLEILRLPRCRITDEKDLLSLQHCATLKTLHLNEVVLTTWKAVLKALPVSLESLDCSQCAALNDDAVVELEGKNKLTHLLLNRTGIKGEKFRKLPTSITELYCSGCYSLNGLAFLYANHLKLTLIDASFTNIAGFGLVYTPKSLRTLNLEGCENLEDSALSEFAEEDPELQSLNLRNTKTKIKDNKINLKCDWLPKLTSLKGLFISQDAAPAIPMISLEMQNAIDLAQVARARALVKLKAVCPEVEIN